MAKRPRLKFGFRDSDPNGDTLKRLARQFNGVGEKPYIKVGVLGGAARDKTYGHSTVKGASHGAGQGGVNPASLGKTGPSGIDNTRLAAIHEFGAPKAHIPARSFLGATFDGNREKYFGLLASATDAIIESRVTPYQALSVLGYQVLNDVRARMRAGIAPALSPRTLARKQALTRAGSKGSPIALIDTGQLINSLTFHAYAPKSKLSSVKRRFDRKRKRAAGGAAAGASFGLGGGTLGVF